MFKYKYTIATLLLLVLPALFILISKWNKEKIKSDNLLINNIKFSGEIVDLKVSGNHLFGIIRLKVDSTNTKMFLPSDVNMYPYRIKDSIAEIYHYVSHDLKKGIKVKVDSDKKIISFYDRDIFMYDLDMWIVTEKENIKFIRNNTIIGYDVSSVDLE